MCCAGGRALQTCQGRQGVPFTLPFGCQGLELRVDAPQLTTWFWSPVLREPTSSYEVWARQRDLDIQERGYPSEDQSYRSEAAAPNLTSDICTLTAEFRNQPATGGSSDALALGRKPYRGTST